MLTDVSRIDHIYIACGHTDLRYGIDGLAAKIRMSFGMDTFSNSLFLFCGKRNDRIKGLLWQGDGYLLLYKRLENGSFRWPRDSSELKELSEQQYRWLTEGLIIEPKKCITKVYPGRFQ